MRDAWSLPLEVLVGEGICVVVNEVVGLVIFLPFLVVFNVNKI